MIKIAILGSTGSIGTQTLDIVRKNKDLQVLGLAAGRNISMLEEQIREFSPRLAAVGDEEKAAELRERVKDTDCKGSGRYGWTSGTGGYGRHTDSCHSYCGNDRNPSYY